jgi:hypothetical protein
MNKRYAYFGLEKRLVGGRKNTWTMEGMEEGYEPETERPEGVEEVHCTQHMEHRKGASILYYIRCMVGVIDGLHWSRPIKTLRTTLFICFHILLSFQSILLWIS